MTDTQTAFVLVPREANGICECQLCGRAYNFDLLVDDAVWNRIKPPDATKGGGLLCPDCILMRTAWACAVAFDGHHNDQSGKVTVCGKTFTLSAAPKPPESEIGPVAWATVGGDANTSIEITRPLTDEPLYPQARIDADADIIAALRAEVAGLRHDVESAGSLRLRLNAYRNRAEAAEARVKELEAALARLGSLEAMTGEGRWQTNPADIARVEFTRAALASKKETVDERPA